MKVVYTDDIAPNLRYVHMDGYRALTITLSKEEGAQFPAWCNDSGIKIHTTFNSQHHTQFILTMLSESAITQIKLAWARYDIASSPRIV